MFIFYYFTFDKFQIISKEGSRKQNPEMSSTLNRLEINKLIGSLFNTIRKILEPEDGP